MRKRFTESRTYEQAVEIANRRIQDAILLYDRYREREALEKKSYFIARPCPFCGMDDYTEEPKFHERYGVARCRHCHSLYVNPCPTQEVLNDYYVNYECNAMLEAIYQQRAQKEHSAILDTRVETILNYLVQIPRNELRILEIGCSNGSFLRKLRQEVERRGIKKQVQYVGVDTNRNAVLSNTDPQIELVHATIEDYLETDNIKFDMIWHAELIEHIIDPYGLFQKLYHAMNDDSYMIFTTPNDNSIEMKVLSYHVPRILACNIFPPMHLNAFSTVNIAHFALRNQFRIVSIETPGQFDVEIFELQKDYIKNDLIRKITLASEDEKADLQDLICMAGGSSHMQCVLAK